jgi:hypothetical protein
MDDIYDLPTEQLPAWMRRARQSVDWGILIVLFFSLVAAWPYVLYENLPHTNDAENHVYAVADYAQSLREGVMYPRWNAAALNGYGAPIYNYTPPGVSYLAGLLDVLFTANDAQLALRLVMIGAFLLSGAMTYVLVLRVSGAIAAIFAAVLYVYSPYVGLVAPHVLGDYSTVLTFALYPAALWNFTRLLTFQNPFDSIIGGLIFAGIILIQPEAAFVTIGLMPPVIFWWLDCHPPSRLILSKLVRVAIVIGLGIGLSAFFWWPAWVEQATMIWQAPMLPALDLSLTWGEILNPVQRIDLQALNPTPQLRLGWPLLMSGIGTWAYLLYRRWNVRIPLVWHGLYVLWAVVLMLIGLTFFSDTVWLLAPISLCLAVGGGGLVFWRLELSAQWRRIFLPLLVVIALVWNFPVWLSVRPASSFGDTDDYARILYEQQGFGVAVLPRGTFVPVTLESPYVANLALIDGYRSGTPIRVPNIRLTGEKVANFIRSATHSDRYLVDAREVVIFDVLRAYDVGWEAWLNGQRMELSSNPANGLIQVRVPAVESGQLDIRLGATPAQRAGWAISAIVGLFLGVRTIRMTFRYSSPQYVDDLTYIPVIDARWMAGLCAVFLGVVLMLASPLTSWTLHASKGHSLTNYEPLAYRSDVGLEVVGYQLHTSPNQHQRELSFSLAWRTSRPLLENYQVRLTLVSVGTGWRWPLVEPHHPAQVPTRRWESGYHLVDRLSVTVNHVPRGRYRLAVELMPCEVDCLPERRIAFFNARGQSLGSLFMLPFEIDVP